MVTPFGHPQPSRTLDRWAAVRERARTWEPPTVPTVVVVPHPDDEALATGGLIRRQTARGVPVVVLAVTDGEAAYPWVEHTALARLRRQEQRAALAALGLTAPARRLALPDGRVAEHEADLTDVIADHCRDAGLVVAPWTRDHHPDHEACGRAARLAAQRHGVAVAQSLFWAWHHRDPADFAQEQLLALQLSAGEQQWRWLAVACHRTQVTDEVTARQVISVRDLESLWWPTEYYVAARSAPTSNGPKEPQESSFVGDELG